MTSKQLIKKIEADLAGMRSELAALEASGLGGDLKAIVLRDCIPATEYRLQLEREEAAAPKRDMRFTCAGRSQHLRKVPPSSAQSLADALKACTGATSVSVTDGDDKAVSK